jgi:hypothetical protein
MKETSKAMRRRMSEDSGRPSPDTSGFLPWSDIFKGKGVDVGSGDDPLKVEGCEITHFDLTDGGGDDLTRFLPIREFDFIHGSNVLEHAIVPMIMIQSWLHCLHEGGYVVATVPDWELYEKKIWPSKWNAGHRTRWTMNVREAMDARQEPSCRCATFDVITGKAVVERDMILLPQWLEQFPVEILLCRLVSTNYDHSLGPEIDQTFRFEDGVEAFIEFVLRKKL